MKTTGDLANLGYKISIRKGKEKQQTGSVILPKKLLNKLT